jgi:UDP-N-acetylmuramate: L-alanyl-gamma-D-glutamyl-meso-diaminopimelate ligase
VTQPMDQARLDIYMIAIGGTGMAPLACLLQDQGHRVRGADGPLYPPMSTLLERAGIRPHGGYDAAHLEPRPDLVVVGNAVRRDNPEAVAAAAAGLPLLSMPQALARFFLAHRRPLVVAGTHGKTTTTAMAAWVYSQCGADPGYLIGGAPCDLPGSFAAGGAAEATPGGTRRQATLDGQAPAGGRTGGASGRFIVEGDEYNAAYFDRGAKFLHYLPETLILTSVEYDHADLYASPEALRDAYRRLIALLPRDGLLVACGATPEVRELAREAPCRTILYGLDGGNEVRLMDGFEALPEASRFRVTDAAAGEVTIELPLAGSHNVENALAVWAAARRDGLPASAVAAALARFHGVQRRLQELGSQGGVTVVDDFAHHPTAVGKTLAALRQRYPGRRLVALFEPRSLTAGRTMFFDAYREAFAAADQVLFAPTFYGDRLAADERLDFGALAAALAAGGTAAWRCDSVDQLLDRAVAASRPGDVLVTMSSGSFEGLPRRLLATLGTAAAAGGGTGGTGARPGATAEAGTAAGAAAGAGVGAAVEAATSTGAGTAAKAGAAAETAVS